MINQKGFTLIESIIYLFLFAIIIGGGMVATYQIIESTNASHNHVILQEEANFFFRKFDWTLTGAKSIVVEDINPVDSVYDTLKIEKADPVLTWYTFTSSGDDFTLQRDSADFIDLNSSSIAVSNVSFIKTPASGSTPDSIMVNFTLTTFQNGRPATQDFSFTKYLRTVIIF